MSGGPEQQPFRPSGSGEPGPDPAPPAHGPAPVPPGSVSGPTPPPGAPPAAAPAPAPGGPAGPVAPGAPLPAPGPGGGSPAGGPPQGPAERGRLGRLSGLPARARTWLTPRRRLPLAAYAACQLLLFGWWAAFHPGRITGDSLTYLYEVSTSHWRSDHSVAYDALLWLSLQITGGIAALTLAQTVAMAAALAYVCTALRDLGVRGRWSAPVAVLVAGAPMTGAFTVYVWKDVAYTIAAIVAFGAAVQLTARRLRGRERRRDASFARQVTVFGLGLLGVGLFRNNGFPVILAAGVLVVALLPGMRRWTAVAAGAALAVSLLTNNLLYPALGVQQPRADEIYAFNYADIGVAYAKRPDTFTPSDLRLMSGIAPLSHWRGPGGNCHVADPIMHKPMDRLKAGRENGQLLALWFRILRRTPSLIIDARLCRADIAWAFTGHTGMYAPSNHSTLASWASFGLSSYRQLPYAHALPDDPLSFRLDREATKAYTWTQAPERTPFLWRGANWTYIGYLVVLLAVARRRRYELLALAALPIALQLTVIAANPSPLWRYMSASLFLGALTVPALALLGPRDPHWRRPGRRPSRDAEGGTGGEARAAEAADGKP